MPSQPGLFSDQFAAEVIETPVADEMSESFLQYSLSVITARAIPDVRDGLKPVQRRILYSMLQQGIRPDSDFRKCAGVVGDTMGKYHPHGDSAIYETLVRMGQDFTRMVTFITPQGNFGTLDDPPAAYRYTECKLSDAAMAMVNEIGEDTVDFRPTFDGLRDEPEVLPALIPSLLVNGTTGIAVGMATNMPTHNLREVYDAIEIVMTKRRPKPTIEQLMKVLPGPDFPSGGIVIDDGLKDAYETGRGTFRMRARAETIKLTRSRQALVISELPYMVGPEKVITRINELAGAGKLPGVDEREGAKNLSDKTSGLRIQIDLRPGANASSRVGQPLPADAARGDVRHQQRRARQRCPDDDRTLRALPELHRPSPRCHRPANTVPPREVGGQAPHRRRVADRTRQYRPGDRHHPQVEGRSDGRREIDDRSSTFHRSRRNTFSTCSCASSPHSR